MVSVIPISFAETFDVKIPTGVSVPGCEQQNMCFNPHTTVIFIGDSVMWANSDSAAHTVTSGTAQLGPDGFFDSNLLSSGNTFEINTNNYLPDQYNYFCQVHPWMSGVLIVEEKVSIPEPPLLVGGKLVQVSTMSLMIAGLTTNPLWILLAAGSVAIILFKLKTKFS